MKNDIEDKPNTMRARQAAAYLSVTTKTIWEWARKGILPKPIRLSRRCSVWRVGDLDAFLDRREQESRG